jgi:hypothetical protein
VFAAIFLMGVFQVIAKAAAVALLAVTSTSWLLQYVVADNVLHLIYRVARNDAVMYIPLPPAASYVMAPLQRVVMKTISDFTGSLLFRLPLQLGGSYWLFNLAMSQASVFACVHLYLEYASGDGADKIAAGTLWAGAGGLAAGWLLTFTYERASDANGPPCAYLTLAHAQLFRVPHRGAQVQAHALVVDYREAVRAGLLPQGPGRRGQVRDLHQQPAPVGERHRG